MKVGRILFIAVFTVMLSTRYIETQAQQQPQQALFAENLNIYNPGYCGINDQLEINGGVRYQWIGLNGSPFSQSLNIHSPVYQLHGGIGLTVLNQQQGLQRNTSAGLNYSYIIRKPKYQLGFGLKIGALQSYLNGERIITPSGNYEATVINHNDPILPISGISKVVPDVSAGMVLYGRNAFAGVSVLTINEPNLKLTSSNSPTLVRQFLFQAGKRIKINKKVSLSNNYLIKTDLFDTQAETNLTFNYKQLLRFGVGYRGSQINTDALLGLISLKLNNRLSASYVFEYPVSLINKAAFSSQELLLSYRFDISTVAKPGKIIYNPRF